MIVSQLQVVGQEVKVGDLFLYIYSLPAVKMLFRVSIRIYIGHMLRAACPHHESILLYSRISTGGTSKLQLNSPT
jgi:hypothetical protein